MTRGTGVLVHRGDGQAGPVVWGMGTGWVYRVGNTGTYPASTLLGEGPRYSEAGPGSPSRGAGVGGIWVPGARCSSVPPLRGPVGLQPPCTLPPLSSQTAVQTSKTSENMIISAKLVKTAECHRNMSKRPSIVPISKTGSRNHLLIFLDFRFRQPSLTRN